MNEHDLQTRMRTFALRTLKLCAALPRITTKNNKDPERGQSFLVNRKSKMEN